MGSPSFLIPAPAFLGKYKPVHGLP
jgi:hypothetical protein